MSVVVSHRLPGGLHSLLVRLFYLPICRLVAWCSLLVHTPEGTTVGECGDGVSGVRRINLVVQEVEIGGCEELLGLTKNLQ